MSNPLPMFPSIKSDWKYINESPVLGKDVLELLSSSMYVNPLSVYREYVQNATDSIEETVAIGLLANSAEGRIDITVDAQERGIKIRDNGIGLRHSEFVKRLIALGASRKRGMKARGFRGVGRLAGTPNDGQHLARVYIGSSPRNAAALRTYIWYKRFLVEGAGEHALPPDYIAMLETIEAVQDANLERDRMNRAIGCHATGYSNQMKLARQ